MILLAQLGRGAGEGRRLPNSRGGGAALLAWVAGPGGAGMAALAAAMASSSTTVPPSQRPRTLSRSARAAMAARKQKRWNILAAVSLVLAIILGVLGLAHIDVVPMQNRDALRLTSASRALTTDPARLRAGDWTSLRGERLSEVETAEDQQALERAKHHLQVGVYANSAYDLDLSVPSFSSNGYV
ncbi:MAG: hypothetical protein ACKO02_13060, partial [Cyanobium sp.]